LKGGMRDVKFFRLISITLEPFDQNNEFTKFGRTTHVGAYFKRVSHAPTAKGQDPSAPQFWGFPSNYAYTLCRRTTKFDLLINMEMVFEMYGVSHAPLQGGMAPAFSPILGVLLYYAYTV